MPQVKKLVLNGAPVSDTTELDNWFREKMKAFCVVVNAAAPKQAAAAPVSATPTTTEEESHTDAPAGEPGNDEDVPF